MLPLAAYCKAVRATCNTVRSLALASNVCMVRICGPGSLHMPDESPASGRGLHPCVPEITTLQSSVSLCSHNSGRPFIKITTTVISGRGPDAARVRA